MRGGTRRSTCGCMTKITRFALLGALAVSGCGTVQPFVPDQARLPPGAFGGFNQDVQAVNQAQWAFADSGRTRNRPVEAARATAAMMYIAGQLYVAPRWQNLSAITKEQLLEGRQEVRDVLGVAPAATTQQVVDGLLAAGNALAANDRPAAVRALSGPAFPAGGERELAVLTNLPFMTMANVSTMRAANELFDSTTNDRM